jgi:hypothetical protein
VPRALEQVLEVIEHEQQVRSAMLLADGRQVGWRHCFGEVGANSRGRWQFVKRPHQQVKRRFPLVDEVEHFTLAVALSLRATAPVRIWHHRPRRAGRLLGLVPDPAAQQRQHSVDQQRRLACTQGAYQHGEPTSAQGTREQLRLCVESAPALTRRRRWHARHQTNTPVAAEKDIDDRGKALSPDGPCVSNCHHPA